LGQLRIFWENQDALLPEHLRRSYPKAGRNRKKDFIHQQLTATRAFKARDELLVPNTAEKNKEAAS
jgi:hypothetical protein